MIKGLRPNDSAYHASATVSFLKKKVFKSNSLYIASVDITLMDP